MRLCQVLIVTVTCLLVAVWACNYHNGCKIVDGRCKCGWECETEYIYKTRSACRTALNARYLPTASTVAASPPERIANICSRAPCLRGICIQTTNDIGFTCKCEGTGFYGQRCEKACPTTAMRGMVFPHECVVI